MNPAQLLSCFDRISEASDAIPRLRLFILDLAVRGKLVEQDPRDEPASELFKRIQLEKARLVKEGEVRRELLLPSLLPEEIPFQLPSQWQWLRLGEIGLTQTGTTPPSNNPEYFGDYIPFVKPAALTGNIIDYSGAGISKSGVEHSRLIPKHSVLMVCIGSSIGKVNVTDRDVCCNQQINTVTPCLEHLTKFISFALKSDYFQKLVLANAGMGTLPIISKGKWEILPISLPPLAEQHRIVAKVDELMALCNRLEAVQAERESRRDRLVASSLNRLNNGVAPDAFRDHARFYFNHLPYLTTRLEHIQQFRQTILNLAVRGKLVPQDSNDEPSSLLYDRLNSQLAKVPQMERARLRKDLLPAADGFFSTDVFPPSWVLTNFDKLNAIISGVAKGKDLRGLKTATYPYLRVANVQRGYLDLAVVKELEICADEFSRYQLRLGDVLMTEGGDWDKLGRAAIWNDEVPNCIHQNHIYRIRPANKEELLPEWIVLFANSPLGRSYFEGASKQTTNLASINMTQLRSCPLPLPPLAEQHRIVAKVEELMALCDRLEAQLTTTHTESRRLLEAVLHEALTETNRRELADTSCR